LELCRQSENYPNPDKLLMQIVEIKKTLSQKVCKLPLGLLYN